MSRAGPLAAYRARLDAGELVTDPAQALVAERLEALWVSLGSYAAHPVAEPKFLGRLLGRKRRDDMPGDYPHGIYLVGDVGRGKSMLMDLFFETANVPLKRRIHFHQFMQDVHSRIYAWRRAPHRLADPHSDDPIPPLADLIAGEASLLCFDEFQVNDVADAMILGRLFRALFARGVVVVATSNTPPDELFAGQPGRDAFLPFIALLKQHLDVLVIAGDRDWRRQRLRGMPTWHVPSDDRADRALDAAFAELTGGAKPRTERLTVMGHTLTIPLSAQGVARFDFDALCGQPLGAGDYLALATHYQALVLDGVPRLSPDNYDLARRFV
ncbi:MAG: cell division protein ZapE, partial [Gemmatimonadaceae bacterium]|nr:cell division protein ZapE [Acetobacteraceae bacterium]